jgi:hypothetical protein
MLSMVAFMALTASAVAQKGKPQTPVAAVATLRCPGASCPVADPTSVPPVLTDAITGDGYDLPYLLADGVRVDSAGELALYLEPSGRSLRLDFTNGLGPCVGCKRTFPSITIDAGLSAAFHTNVIDPVSGEEAALGLRSIPVGQTWRSRLKIAFNTVNAAGQTVQWAVRFNPRDYYPSDHISVTRAGLKQWVLYASAVERAMLVSVCCRQRTPTNEGLYVMPFRMEVNEQ